MKKIIAIGTAALLILLMIPSVIGCGALPEVIFEASVTSGQAPLNITFINQTEISMFQSADEFLWDFGDGDTETTITVEEFVTHEYTKAGSYTVTLSVVKEGDPPETSTMTLDITVKHGTLDLVELNQETVTLNIGGNQEFTAEMSDAYGNPISDAQLTWEVANEAGTITSDGILTAGTRAGLYSNSVTVTASLDDDSVQETRLR